MRKKISSLVFAGSLVLLVGCSSQVTLEPKQEVFEVEYGQAISTKAKDYFTNEDEVLSKVELTTTVENEQDKEYADIGEYTLSFIYDGKEDKPYEVKVVVKDTTAPTIQDLDAEYKLEYGTKLSTDMFVNNVTDLDEFEVTIDDASVDYSTAGTYTATIIVKDKSGNETKQDISVVVEEKPQEVVQEPAQNEVANDYVAPPVSGNSGGTSNNQPVAPTPPVVEQTPPPVVEKPQEPTPPACNYNIGNSGMLFDTEAEAIAWAENQMDIDKGEIYRGYVGWSTCGKFTIDFTYK